MQMSATERMSNTKTRKVLHAQSQFIQFICGAAKNIILQQMKVLKLGHTADCDW